MEHKIKQALLTTKEVSDYFKVSEATITKKFIPRGLKYIKLSARDYRYNINDVYEFEDSLKIENASYKHINRNNIKNYPVNKNGVRIIV